MTLTHRDPAESRSPAPPTTRTGTAAVLGRLAAWSWQPAALVLWIVVGTPLFGSSTVYPLLVLAGIYGIAVCGVSLLAGLGGQMSLGQAVFMAMGAYASALATTEWGLSPLVGLALGICAALTLAAVVSPILRLRGWYLAMATVAISFLLQQVVVNLRSITGGNNGIFGVPPLSIGAIELSDTKSYFVFSWTVVLVAFVLGRNIARSRFGRSLTAISKDADAAATLGINPARAKAVLWLVAAVPAAVAGSTFAHYSAFVAPTDFSFATSLLLITAVLVGGERSIFGALVMVTVIVATSAYANQVFTSELIEAILLIVIYMLSPQGLAGIATSALRAVPTIGRRDA
jgi:branched-chain amino acid transport system permease protein